MKIYDNHFYDIISYVTTLNNIFIIIINYYLYVYFINFIFNYFFGNHKY